jgi:hypothetical protein
MSCDEKINQELLGGFIRKFTTIAYGIDLV